MTPFTHFVPTTLVNNFFIFSAVVRYSGCFQVWITLSNAAMDIPVHVSWCLSAGIFVGNSTWVWNFWVIEHEDGTNEFPILLLEFTHTHIPRPAVCEGSSAPYHMVFVSEVVSHCSFNVISQISNGVEPCFICSWPLNIFFCSMPVLVFCPFFYRIVYLLFLDL